MGQFFSQTISSSQLMFYSQLLYSFHNQQSEMLAKHLTKRFMSIARMRYNFSSSSTHHEHGQQHHDHDHDHHHEDYSVHIDKQTPWIKYNSDPKYVSFFGVEDTNYKLQPLIRGDPFEHLKDQPFFSWNRFVYNDPWYHDESHEPYNSLPERGYKNFEDPLQTRSFYAPNALLVKVIVGTVLILLGFVDKDMTYSEAATYSEKISRDFVLSELNNLNKQINDLRSKESELLQALSSQ